MTSAEQLELIGRGGEQARLDALLDNGRAGRSGGLVLRGEPGVGKTRLLDWIVGRALDFRVLRALGVQSESDLAFSGLLELLRPVADRGDELPGSQANALAGVLTRGRSAEVDRFAVYAATLGLLALIAEDQPLLCVIDDAQWVDVASCEALLFTTRRLSNEGVIVLFAARDGEASYFDARGVASLPLEGLAREDAIRLVRASSHEPLASAVMAHLATATGGNPLALVEIPRSLRDEQRSGQEPLDDPLRGGAAVEGAFGARVAALSPGARRALLVAAICDTEELASIVAACGNDAACLDEAETAGLISIEGERLRFRHPLVRSAVSSRETAGARRAAHLALASALTPFDVDRAVWHRALGAVGYDEEVAERLVEVADRTRRRGGVDAQARLLERAARLTSDTTIRADRLYEAGRAAYHAGRGGYAAALLDEALDLARDPLLRADVVGARTAVARALGGIARWLDVCRREAERIATYDTRRASQLLWQVWDYAAEQLDIAGGRLLVDRMVALSDGPGDIYVLNACAWQAMLENDVLEVRRTTYLAIERYADQAPERTLEFAYELVFLGDLDVGRRLLEPLLERFRRDGSLLDLSKALEALAYLECRAGRLAAGQAAATEAVALLEEAGLDYWLCDALAALSVIEALLGKFSESELHAARVLDLSPRVGLRSVSTDAWYARGVVALTAGHVEDAIAYFDRCRDILSGAPSIYYLWQPDLIDAYLRSGRPAAARETLVLLEPAGSRSRPDAAIVARCRAMLADDVGADDAFAEAMQLCDGDDCAFERARCHLAYGERLRRAGQRIAARTELRAALEALEHIGAAGFAERARQELRATGETVRARAGDDENELTAQELQVALLVSRGATNREAAASLFLSPKTVERHLSNVYRKLGVRSRTELARTLVDR